VSITVSPYLVIKPMIKVAPVVYVIHVVCVARDSHRLESQIPRAIATHDPSRIALTLKVKSV
jgi:hypothetical protein